VESPDIPGRFIEHRRLYEYCGDVPPDELERPTALNTETSRRAEFSADQKVSRLTGAIHFPADPQVCKDGSRSDP
jgi:hypothetical protein